MKVAIYSRTLQNSGSKLIHHFCELLKQHHLNFILHENIKQEVSGETTGDHFFRQKSDLQSFGCEVLISLGGDGTLLDTLSLVGDSGIPVMGINTGRLGFLANIPEAKFEAAIKELVNNNYRIEERSLLNLETNKPVFKENLQALNDFTIHKRDHSSMVTVEASVDGEYFNTYWADGIIVATPTGSTGYSLSCGGPIIFPGSGNFILTPVAPHNLNIRPIIVPEVSTIEFKVTGRGKNFLVSLDSRYEILDQSYKFVVRKASYSFKLIKIKNQSFIQTLKEKLKWGVDKRNE